MRKSQATSLFIETYYQTSKALHKALKTDRLAVQYEWECFVDSLCRDGNITQDQYNSWTFPWALWVHY